MVNEPTALATSATEVTPAFCIGLVAAIVTCVESGIVRMKYVVAVAIPPNVVPVKVTGIPTANAVLLVTVIILPLEEIALAVVDAIDVVVVATDGIKFHPCATRKVSTAAPTLAIVSGPWTTSSALFDPSVFVVIVIPYPRVLL